MNEVDKQPLMFSSNHWAESKISFFYITYSLIFGLVLCWASEIYISIHAKIDHYTYTDAEIIYLFIF